MSSVDSLPKFLRKCTERQKQDGLDHLTDETYDKSCVTEIAYQKMESIGHYRDSVYQIFEVAENFPTMHFMQQVTDIYEKRIGCVRETYLKVKEKT